MYLAYCILLLINSVVIVNLSSKYLPYFSDDNDELSLQVEDDIDRFLDEIDA